MNTHGHILSILLLVSFLAKTVFQACMLCLFNCDLVQDMSTSLSHVVIYVCPCNDETLFRSDAASVPAPDNSSDSHYVSAPWLSLWWHWIGFNPSRTATECCYHRVPACLSLVASVHKLVVLSASLRITYCS